MDEGVAWRITAQGCLVLSHLLTDVFFLSFFFLFFSIFTEVLGLLANRHAKVIVDVGGTALHR